MSPIGGVIGLTGSRNGGTPAQVALLYDVLRAGREAGFTTLLHGACVGFDKLAAVYARRCGYRVEAHPASDVNPTFVSADALAASHVVHPPAPALERNRDAIVGRSDAVVACPETREEVRRSGTWATIRQARRVARRTVYVWPDGATTYSTVALRELFEEARATATRRALAARRER